jgi:hypothetical protein
MAAACSQNLPDLKMLNVQLSGGKDLLVPLDWAHDLALIPSMWAWPGPQFRESKSATTYLAPIGLPRICKAASLPGSDVITDQSDPSAGSAHDPVWANLDTTYSNQYIVLKHRDAEGAGNAYLASAGVLAGLGIGLIPIAYDASRKRYRHRRRGRASRSKSSGDADVAWPDQAGDSPQS